MITEARRVITEARRVIMDVWMFAHLPGLLPVPQRAAQGVDEAAQLLLLGPVRARLHPYGLLQADRAFLCLQQQAPQLLQAHPVDVRGAHDSDQGPQDGADEGPVLGALGARPLLIVALPHGRRE